MDEELRTLEAGLAAIDRQLADLCTVVEHLVSADDAADDALYLGEVQFRLFAECQGNEPPEVLIDEHGERWVLVRDECDCDNCTL